MWFYPLPQPVCIEPSISHFNKLIHQVLVNEFNEFNT